jgi:hypothetical protein
MNGNISTKDAYELNDFMLNFLRVVSAPNRSINQLQSVIDSYAPLVDSIASVHRKKANKIMTAMDEGHKWNVTEELRRKILEFCAKKNETDPVSIAYVQLNALNTARKYVKKMCSDPLATAKQQQLFCTYYYAGNWWMNLFLVLEQKYPRNLEFFNALGEIRH